MGQLLICKDNVVEKCDKWENGDQCKNIKVSQKKDFSGESLWSMEQISIWKI